MNLEPRYPTRLRLFLGLTAVLIVPLVPFLAVGWYLEPHIEQWLESSRQRPIQVGFIAAISLVADIFMPIPSSFVCTTAGQILGIPLGTVVCLAGLQTGTWFGWWTGRKFGSIWIEKTCGGKILETGRETLEKWGGWAIVVSRPIPLLAEAVVLLLGTHPDRFVRWLPWLLLSNLSIALVWCSLGEFSRVKHAAGLAGIISVVVPTAFLIAVRLFRSNRSGDET